MKTYRWTVEGMNIGTGVFCKFKDTRVTYTMIRIISRFYHRQCLKGILTKSNIYCEIIHTLCPDLSVAPIPCLDLQIFTETGKILNTSLESWKGY